MRDPAALNRAALQPLSAKENRPRFVNDRDKTTELGISAEDIETLLWLAESQGIDRRRHRIVGRLRSVRDSDGFAALPDDLRKRVREIVADSR